MKNCVIARDKSAVVAHALYGDDRPCTIELIRPHTRLADSCAIFLVDGDYILHLSSPAFPETTQKQVDAMRLMRARLGPAAPVILPIAAEGLIDGCKFFATPRLRPLRRGRLLGRVDRLRARRAALNWTRQVAALRDAPSAEAAANFLFRLRALARMDGLDPRLTMAAHGARALIEGGALAVGHVPMHGDLWFGNLLADGNGAFRIIDWAGSQSQGYGLYDLVRVCESLRASRRTLQKEIRHHADLLGGPRAAEAHLLAALGHYAADLGEFPHERFIAMAHTVWSLFDTAR